MKTTLLLLTTFLFLILNSSLAQNLDKKWDDLYSATDNLISFTSDVDLNGNVYVCGSVLNAGGHYDLIFLKYDNTGTLEWSRKTNGSFGIDDLGISVVCDFYGNSFWVGNTNEGGALEQPILYKYDTNGNLIWTYNISVVASKVTDLKRDDNGNVLLIGEWLSGGINKVIVESVNEINGTLNWSGIYNYHSNHTKIRDGKIDINGNLILAGSANYSSAHSRTGNYMVSINSNGAVNWEFFDVVNNSDNNEIKSFDINWNNEIVAGSNYTSYVASGNAPTKIRLIRIANTNGSFISESFETANNYKGERVGKILIDSNSDTYLITDVSLGVDNRIVTYKLDANDAILYRQSYQLKNYKFVDAETYNGYVALVAKGEHEGVHSFSCVVYDENGAEVVRKNFSGDYSSSSITDLRLDASGSVYLVGSANTPAKILTLKIGKINFIVPPDYLREGVSRSHIFYQNKGQLIDGDGLKEEEVRFLSNGGYPKMGVFDTEIGHFTYHADSIDSTLLLTSRVNLGFVTDIAEVANPVGYKPVLEHQSFYHGDIKEAVEHVTGYERIIYPEVWNGISVQAYSGAAGGKIAIVMQPGASVQDVRLKFTGHSNIDVSSGDMEVQTAVSAWGYKQAIAYQLNTDGSIVKLNWKPKYILTGNQVTFQSIGAFDSNKPLIFQMGNGPVGLKAAIGNLEWSSYISSTTSQNFNGDGEKSVGVEAESGLIYYLGITESPYIIVPTNGNPSFSNGGAGKDAQILCLNDNLEAQFSLFYGGTGDVFPTSISVGKNTSHQILIGGYHQVTMDSPVLLPIVGPTAQSYTEAIDLQNIGPADQNNSGFIARFSKGGILEWSTNFGRPRTNEWITDVELTLDGDMYVTGGTNTYSYPGNPPPFFNYLPELSGLIDPVQAALGSGFLLKFNDNAEPIYFTDIMGESIGRAMESDSYGNLVITGAAAKNFQSGNVMTNYNNNPAFQVGSTNALGAFIVYLDNNDEVKFRMGYNEGAMGHDIAINDAGKIDVIIESFPNGDTRALGNSTDEYLQVNSGISSGVQNEGLDAFILELEYPSVGATTGTVPAVNWASYFGGDYSESFFQDVLGPQKFTINRDVNDHIFITATVSQRSNFSGGPGAVVLPLPVAQPQGFYYLEDFQQTPPTGKYGHDGLIAAFNADKKLLWSTMFGGQGMDIIRGACIADNDKFYIAGFTESGIYTNPGDPFEFELVDYDDFLLSDFFNRLRRSTAFGARFSTEGIDTPLTNIGIETMEHSFLLYPNPTENRLTISGLEEIELVQAFNMEGKLIYSKSVRSNTVEVNTQNWANGVYHIQVQTLSAVHTAKVLKL